MPLRASGSSSTVKVSKLATGGGAYPFVACLSHLTIDHASLSRRDTVPTPNRDTSNIWALISFFRCYLESFLLIFSPCCFAVCGHHLSPRIAIVFSLLCSVPNLSMSHSSIFLISSTTSRSSLSISHSPTSEFYSLLLCHKGTSVLFPPDYWHTVLLPPSFWQVQVPYTKSQFQRFRVVHWAVQIRFHSYFFS